MPEDFADSEPQATLALLSFTQLYSALLMPEDFADSEGAERAPGYLIALLSFTQLYSALPEDFADSEGAEPRAAFIRDFIERKKLSLLARNHEIRKHRPRVRLACPASVKLSKAE